MKRIATILIAIFTMLVGFMLLSFMCDDAKAGNLNGQAGYEAALLNLLHASSSHDDWTQAKIREFINEGITFVEGVSKENEVHDTITFNTDEDVAADTGFYYALSADARSGGVLNVIYGNSTTGELVALAQRNIEDFGKDNVQGKSTADFTYMYSEAFDTLMFYPIPDVAYIAHVISYKVSDWMTGVGADTLVTLPLFHRLLALEMAYGYAMLSTGTADGRQAFFQIKQGVLEAIYGLPPEPQAQVQSLGIEGTGQ